MTKIVILSDIHVGYTEAQQPNDLINQFLTEMSKQCDAIILAGDIMELWRRDLAGVMLENCDFIKTLKEISKITKLIWIVGNHDYHLVEMGSIYQYPFGLIKEYSFQVGEQVYRVVHGNKFDFPCSNDKYNDQMCYGNDTVGYINESLWKNILKVISKKKTPIQTSSILKNVGFNLDSRYYQIFERVENPGVHGAYLNNVVAKNALKEKNPNEFLIYGHTHYPYVNLNEKIANDGAWISGSTDYIEVTENGAVLKKY